MESEISPKEEFAAARLNSPVTFLLAANLTRGLSAGFGITLLRLTNY
jgi:hypothetical protein